MYMDAIMGSFGEMTSNRQLNNFTGHMQHVTLRVSVYLSGYCTAPNWYLRGHGFNSGQQLSFFCPLLVAAFHLYCTLYC